jgi:hypothetical protein
MIPLLALSAASLLIWLAVIVLVIVIVRAVF